MLTSCLVLTSVVIKTTKVVADTTRSQRRQEELSEVERVACDRESGAMLSPLEEEVVPFSELDDDLFTESQGRPKLTKSPKREKRGSDSRECRRNLLELQKMDESLEPVGIQVMENPDGVSSRGGFFTKHGVLYRTRTPVEWLVFVPAVSQSRAGTFYPASWTPGQEEECTTVVAALLLAGSL